MLEAPALLWEKSMHSGKLHLRESLIDRPKHQIQQSSSKTKLHGACIPAFVPLPRCCFRDPLVGEVTKTNILLAFHPWFCGCSCILPVSAHSARE